MNDFLSVPEAAADWGSHPWTVWRACRLGVIPGVYRVGVRPDSGPFRIPRKSWEKFKADRLVKPPGLRLVADGGELLIDQILRGSRA